MSEKDVTSSHGTFKTPVWRWWTPRLLSGAVGLILLAAGLVKAMDMELFIRQIMDYGIVSERLLLILSAWGLIALECALGVALLVFYRPRLMLSGSNRHPGRHWLGTWFYLLQRPLPGQVADMCKRSRPEPRDGLL
jgi:hypothetical protein